MTDKVCSIDGCGKRMKSRGWCQTHYMRWVRNQDINSPVETRFYDPEESFAARAKRAGDCLIWTGSVGTHGYGEMRVNGKMTKAHRFAWELSNGPIPDGMFVDHTCWNKACCEVDHLRLVTQKQNMENRQGASSTSRSGVRGVAWDEKSQKWLAVVGHNNKMHRAGRFDSIEEAEAAAIAKRRELFTHSQN